MAFVSSFKLSSLATESLLFWFFQLVNKTVFRLILENDYNHFIDISSNYIYYSASSLI